MLIVSPARTITSFLERMQFKTFPGKVGIISTSFNTWSASVCGYGALVSFESEAFQFPGKIGEEIVLWKRKHTVQ